MTIFSLEGQTASAEAAAIIAQEKDEDTLRLCAQRIIDRFGLQGISTTDPVEMFTSAFTQAAVDTSFLN